MRISRLTVAGFRGVSKADLRLGSHSILVGPNNVGKTTIIEAIALSQAEYVAVAQMVTLEGELAQARAAVDAAKRTSDESIATFRQQYPATLQFAYGTPKYEKPFFVRAIWHDGRFTYIKSDARELPALYELTDSEPALVNFQVQGNTYVVPKVLERGYLALGKERFAFQQGR